MVLFLLSISDDMKKLTTFILKHRIAVIVITIILTLISAWELRKIEINSDVTTYLPADDPSVKLFNDISQEYSSSWTAVLILESLEVFTKENLEEISLLSQELQRLEGIDYVVSLTNILDIRTDEFGFEIGRLIDEYELPSTNEELEQLKQYVLGQKLYKHLVSEDSKHTLIVCQISADYDKNSIAREIKDLVKNFDISQKVYFEGIPFQVLSIMDFIVQDLLLLTPLIIIVILIMLYIGFRSFKWVVLPLVTVGIGITWMMALMSFSGIALTPISDALPVVLFAVGSAYGIHVVNAIRLNVPGKENTREALINAVKDISLAVILAGVTTFAGFLSFVFSSYLTIIRDFGIFAAAGVLIILVLSITFIPAWASFFKKFPGKTSESELPELITNPFRNLIIKRPGIILTLSIILSIAAFTGIPKIERKVDILEYFKPSSSLRQSSNIMNKSFGGSLPVMIRISGDVFDPSTLLLANEAATFLESIDGLSNSRSLAEYIMRLNEAMGEGKQIPDSREKIQNLWFMLEGEEMMQQMVNYEMDEVVVYASMKNMDARSMHDIYDKIEYYVKQYPGKMQATGMQAIYSKLGDSMMNNLLQSMLLAFIFVFTTMIFLIGSVKGAIAGFSTLFFSMLMVFGLMGYTGIALDIATLLIAGITIGIGIDYSIHFTTAYKRFISQGATYEEAVSKTLATSGKAIVINVVTIIAGFLVLLFANLIPLQQFGILFSVSMLCAGISALTLLPVLIKIFRVNNKPKKNS
jgi:predicted RND superfamily exporter protein